MDHRFGVVAATIANWNGWKAPSPLKEPEDFFPALRSGAEPEGQSVEHQIAIWESMAKKMPGVIRVTRAAEA